MRIHIELDDDLVDKVDRRAGDRGRTRFIRHAIERALDQEERWELIESALGSIDDSGHEWDRDPAAWVREGRRADTRRTG